LLFETFFHIFVMRFVPLMHLQSFLSSFYSTDRHTVTPSPRLPSEGVSGTEGRGWTEAMGALLEF